MDPAPVATAHALSAAEEEQRAARGERYAKQVSLAQRHARAEAEAADATPAAQRHYLATHRRGGDPTEEGQAAPSELDEDADHMRRLVAKRLEIDARNKSRASDDEAFFQDAQGAGASRAGVAPLVHVLVERDGQQQVPRPLEPGRDARDSPPRVDLVRR